MRCVVQRVKNCEIHVEDEIVGRIGEGLLAYLGISVRDTDKDLDYMARKVVELRVFPDDAGKMNLSLKDTGGGIMVISQFTLYGDTRKGRRPSYDAAADPKTAEAYYEKFLSKLRVMGFAPASGRFQAHMDVTYTNMGPVTILVDSEKTF